MANREWYPGLSMTPASKPGCLIPKSTDRRATLRTELEGEMEAEVRTRPTVRSAQPTERFTAANREWFAGLCLTCEKRLTCTFPKPEGGVLHCEEFE
ncbi:MAG: hypothetical protein IT449_08580 [Phycisphaerales bacterium]|nr:hypothetical protein [Phycisphaerales bacterium]